MSFASRQQQTHRHLLATASLAILSLLWLVWSYISASEIETEHRKTLTRQQQTERRRQQSQEENRETRQRLSVWTKIQEEGLNGAENRQLWAEKLVSLHKELKLTALDYEILPATPLPEQGDGQQKLLRNLLKLRLELLHEEDLMHLLERLPQALRALTITRQCRIERLKPTGLSADCLFELITLNPGNP
jgi:hypothetical protein